MSGALHLRLRRRRPSGILIRPSWLSSGLALRHRSMMDAPRPRTPPVHPITCVCRACNPHQPRRSAQADLHALNRWARHTLIGLALGLAVAWIVDLLVGGPGILSIFGVTS